MLKVLIENQAIISLLTFLIGLWVGNRFAIGRDERKERNEAAKPIRSWLLAEIENPDPLKRDPTKDQIDTFFQCLPLLKRIRFAKLLKTLQEIRASEYRGNEYQEHSFLNPEKIKSAAKKLLPYTKKKFNKVFQHRSGASRLHSTVCK